MPNNQLITHQLPAIDNSFIDVINVINKLCLVYGKKITLHNFYAALFSKLWKSHSSEL